MLWQNCTVAPEGRPIDSERKRRRRQFAVFGWTAVIVILLLAWLQSQAGTGRAVGLAIGLPIIAYLLWSAIRLSPAIKGSKRTK